ncbi:MAG: CPBP family intramembrane metalloprotease [Phycisphaerales bacterium]|nr:CPBP family intramembrane metalloprotease [Phycisphaerales bacterium]
MPNSTALQPFDHALLSIVVAFVLTANVRRVWIRRDRAKRGLPPPPPRNLTQLRLLLLSVTTFAVVLVGYWAYSGRAWSLLGLQPPRMDWLGIAGISLLLVNIALIASILLGELPKARRDAEVADELIRLTAPLRRDQSDVPRNAVVVALLGAFEELCFRGFLYFYVSAVWGWAPAALISWVSFALAHISQGPRVAAICLYHGAVFTVLRLLTDSLFVSAIGHAAHNTIVVWAVRAVERLIAERPPTASAVDIAIPGTEALPTPSNSQEMAR